MTATHVLRCAKCEGEIIGTARGAGSPCECGGYLLLYRKLEPGMRPPTHWLRCCGCGQETQGTARDSGRRCKCGSAIFAHGKIRQNRRLYSIAAREAVAGMVDAYCPEGTGLVTSVSVEAGRILVGVDEGTAEHEFCANDTFVIQLPGPSPRELACTCGAVENAKACAVHGDGRSLEAARKMACMSPGEHAAGCPVAPVPGRHGGMRLWPAPFKGAPWTWNRHSLVWIVPHGPAVSAHCLLDDLPAGLVAPCTADLLWHCFYLPPEPQPERREPTPWAPHAGYEDLAVRHG